MTLADEFEIYDSTTADCLEIGDLINLDDEYIEINDIDDAGTIIYVEGYSFVEDEQVNREIDPDKRLNLYKIVD